MNKAFQFLLAGIFYGATVTSDSLLKSSKITFPKSEGEGVSFIVDNPKVGKHKVTIEKVKE